MDDPLACKQRLVEQKSGDDLHPTSAFVNPLLTDLYQISMAYAYWFAGRADEPAAFDLFFRKNPFKGEFTVFAGLEESIRFIASYKFSPLHIQSLKEACPDWDERFWDYLGNIDTSQLKVYAIREGTVVFPRVPLMRVEGPLAVAQLLETTLLNCINYPSLICTMASRIRLAVGKEKKLLEFGLRRAQGPDGAMTASRYAYIGGFDGSSNVQASLLFGTRMKGTVAHSYVTSFKNVDSLKSKTIHTADGTEVNFVESVMNYHKKLGATQSAHNGELASFIAYAQANPNGFLALVDSYDTLKSGLLNFLAVSLALHEMGHKPVGIRLDSGDLAYLSKQCRLKFKSVSEQFDVPFNDLTIVASNDLSEKVVLALNDQKHEIDVFAIGTHLVTCKPQPALGCVYKLVECAGEPVIKLSQDIAKVTVPGRKAAYRLYNSADDAVCDLMIASTASPPVAGKRVLCRHPFDATKRIYVNPSRVQCLHELVWDGKLTRPLPSSEEVRSRVRDETFRLRPDHTRVTNPTPYKVSLSPSLYEQMHDMWLRACPVSEIS